MEINRRCYNEQDVLKEMFRSDDYQYFLDIINQNKDEVEKIDISAIINYNHSIIEEDDMDLLETLYQQIKYYLQFRNFYNSKMQEGLALCVSKVAILNAHYPSLVCNYFKVGDRAKARKNSNPFEEICRLTLLVTKDDAWSNNFKPSNLNQSSSRKLKTNKDLYLDVIAKALNKEELTRAVTHYWIGDIIGDISESLETSNIDSRVPSSATKKENREVLIEQFDRLSDLYNAKLECKGFLGEIISSGFSSKLLSQLDNTMFYAKRNIRIYEQTKVMKK